MGKIAATFERSKRHLVSAALRERTDVDTLESPVRYGRIRDWDATVALWCVYWRPRGRGGGGAGRSIPCARTERR